MCRRIRSRSWYKGEGWSSRIPGWAVHLCSASESPQRPSAVTRVVLRARVGHTDGSQSENKQRPEQSSTRSSHCRRHHHAARCRGARSTRETSGRRRSGRGSLADQGCCQRHAVGESVEHVEQAAAHKAAAEHARAAVRQRTKRASDDEAYSADTSSTSDGSEESAYSQDGEGEDEESEDDYEESEEEEEEWDDRSRRYRRRSVAVRLSDPKAGAAASPITNPLVALITHNITQQQAALGRRLTIQEAQEVTRNAVSHLASVRMTASGKRLPMLLPRTPEAAAGVRASVETDLKATVADMAHTPEWRHDLMAKLQVQTLSRMQADEKVPLAVPVDRLPMAPVARGGQTLAPHPSLAGRVQLKPHSKHKSTPVEIDNSPIAARRPRRTPSKAVDYRQFFKKSADSSVSGSASESDASVPDAASDEDEALARKHTKGGSSTETMQSDEAAVDKMLSHRVTEANGEEFLVKWHGMSYLHAEWISREDMLQQTSGPARVKRFLAKPLSRHHYDERHVFNPEYVQIDRIVYGWQHPDVSDSTQLTWSYLVKWCALPYEAATWEKRADIEALPDGPAMIAAYERRPTLEQRKSAHALPLGRRPDTWTNLDEHQTYKHGNSLRAYQLEGVNWLVYCWVNRRAASLPTRWYVAALAASPVRRAWARRCSRLPLSSCSATGSACRARF